MPFSIITVESVDRIIQMEQKSLEELIVYPEGSIELDHSDISLSQCSSSIAVHIHHQSGFYYQLFLRDSIFCLFSFFLFIGKANVIRTKIIESYECVEEDNVFSVGKNYQHSKIVGSY